MKRGPKPGMPTHARRGSTNYMLGQMDVGDYRYFETTDIGATMRAVNTPASRRPTELQGRVFKCTAWTAVSAARAGECLILVKIERTE